ncbi:hypothetical protein F5884DRAFT_755251 [Xylogone sp. PMI_703]|nr:hypothetical protein F5884DRAFT_755251 [Xylogone sp. PMI_703]
MNPRRSNWHCNDGHRLIWFASQVTYQRHKRECHEDPKRCNYCGVYIRRISRLRRHIQKKHSSDVIHGRTPGIPVGSSSVNPPVFLQINPYQNSVSPDSVGLDYQSAPIQTVPLCFGSTITSEIPLPTYQIQSNSSYVPHTGATTDNTYPAPYNETNSDGDLDKGLGTPGAEISTINAIDEDSQSLSATIDQATYVDTTSAFFRQTEEDYGGSLFAILEQDWHQ